MRIVSWNLARNTTSRSQSIHEGAWRYLASLEPDVALLQEVTPPDWAFERWSVVQPSASPWGSAIVARPELQLSGGQTDWEGGFIQGVLLATGEVTLAGGTQLMLGSVHTVIGKAGDEAMAGHDPNVIKRPKEPVAYKNDVAYAIYRERVHGRRFIVSGDWNIARLWDALHPGTHETDFFTRAESDGWIDCYRLFNKDEGRTWFCGGDAPYQLDHAFCDPDTAGLLVSCAIDPYPAETLSLSDHAPLILELGN
jgi:exonuclease III